MKIRVTIKPYRLAKHLSVGELAKIAEVSQPLVSDIENGNKLPSVPVLCRLAKALGKNPGDIIECK